MDKKTALEFMEMIREYRNKENPYAALCQANRIITALDREIDYQAEEEGWYSELEKVLDGVEE